MRWRRDRPNQDHENGPRSRSAAAARFHLHTTTSHLVMKLAQLHAPRPMCDDDAEILQYRIFNRDTIVEPSLARDTV